MGYDNAWARVCNGGPNGSASCGKEATLVCTDKDGLQWFCCIDHDESCVSITIAEFDERVKQYMEDYKRDGRLRNQDT